MGVGDENSAPIPSNFCLLKGVRDRKSVLSTECGSGTVEIPNRLWLLNSCELNAVSMLNAQGAACLRECENARSVECSMSRVLMPNSHK